MVAGFLYYYKTNYTSTLLYRASANGWTSANFHSNCDNKGPTITIIKTNKDKIFGGFTSLPWDQSGSYRQDTTAFLFSVNLNALYPL